MSALAAQGNRVLFVENTGVRAARLRDLPRLRSRVRNWRRGARGFRDVRPNLAVYSPVVLPFPYSRSARWLNRRLVRRALGRWLAAAGGGRPIVWTFLPTPLARDVIRDLDPKLTVYYCIDDLPSSSRGARRVAGSEAELFRSADLVFVTAGGLRERAARHRATVHEFPFAVSYEKFARVRAAAGPLPADVRDLPRPLVGYLGDLSRKIDQDLLEAASRALPEATFVFVGPPQEGLAKLRRLPNVRLLGPRPHDEVPGYLKAFDVGLVPYHRTRFTAHVYPAKLAEYLAMGLPVAATDLPEIRRLNREHAAEAPGPLIHVGSDPASFVAAIRAALADRTPGAAARRIRVAETNTWAARIARMSELIAEALERRGG
jgi:glycosyltransferase involved in cell wall biosynthesis